MDRREHASRLAALQRQRKPELTLTVEADGFEPKSEHQLVTRPEKNVKVNKEMRIYL